MKIHRPTEKGQFYARHWLEMQDGGSGTWLYAARDGSFEEGRGFLFFFIEITDLPDACGRDAPARWDCSVSIVDLCSIPESEVESALRCCGAPDDELDMTEDEDRLRLAEMLHSYGAKAPMWNESAGSVTFDSYGNCDQCYDEHDPSFRSLKKRARDFCETELFDDFRRIELLDSTIVNALGQTAREYARGSEGLWDRLREIKNGDPEATDAQKFVLRMYQKAEQTLGAGPVPKDIVEGGGNN